MKLKRHNNISEKQVEDALVSNLTYLQNLLSLENHLVLIARQLRLNQGEQIIDLLLSCGQELILVELKVVSYSKDGLSQIVRYRSELEKFTICQPLNKCFY